MQNKAITETKIQPQALDIEEGVLGAVMLEKEAYFKINNMLRSSMFYKPAHEKIYKAIENLFARSEAVDILTVTQELKKSGNLESVGGAYYISQLTSKIASSANIEVYARIVLQKFVAREIIRINTRACTMAYDETTDIFDLIDLTESGLVDVIKNVTSGKKAQRITTVFNELMNRNDVLISKEGLSGVPTGFRDVDKLTGGWQPSDFIIIAARPAMGKTSLMLALARNAGMHSTNKTNVGIFSLEMSSLQLIARLVAMETEVNLNSILRTGLDREKIQYVHSKCARLVNSNIFIDDTPGLSILELKSKARAMVIEEKVGLIIVDYLQLMQGDKRSKQNREQEISEISRGLKALAKELNVPVIALSQLSRAVETRGGEKRPQLSDLRESGSLEQDADIVVFIHRPEYYGTKEYENGATAEGKAELIFAKHRNGPVGTEMVRFIKQYTKFAELSEGYNEEKPPSAIGPNRDFSISTRENEEF
jgi:replicative DNA helicase